MTFTATGTGYLANLQWGFEETAFGTESAAITNSFGNRCTIRVTERNNQQRIYGLGDRDFTRCTNGRFEGSLGITTDIGDGYWMRAVLGAPAVGSTSSAGAGPYTHTFTEGDLPPSLSVELGMDLDTDYSMAFLGWMIDRCTIRGAVGEIVEATLDGPFKDVAKDETFDSTPDTQGEVPLTFYQGTLAIDDQASGATTVYNVQSIDATIANNIASIYGLGSRTMTRRQSGRREYSFRMTANRLGYAPLAATGWGSEGTVLDFATIGANGADDVASGDPTESDTLTLTFTNGGAGTALRSLVMTYTDIYFDEIAYDVRPNELITDDLTFYAKNCTSWVMTDNSATCVGDS